MHYLPALLSYKVDKNIWSLEKYAGAGVGCLWKNMWGARGVSNGIVLNMSHRAIPFEIPEGVRKYMGRSCGKICGGGIRMKSKNMLGGSANNLTYVLRDRQKK